MVPEAQLEETEDGLLPAEEGWFVLNACEALAPRCGEREVAPSRR